MSIEIKLVGDQEWEVFPQVGKFKPTRVFAPNKLEAAENWAIKVGVPSEIYRTYPICDLTEEEFEEFDAIEEKGHYYIPNRILSRVSESQAAKNKKYIDRFPNAEIEPKVVCSFKITYVE